MRAEDVPRRLSELAERHSLDAHQRAQLGSLLALLEEDPRAPTAVSTPARAVDAHVADSLSALDLEPVERARSIVDVGSGAGLPGLVLAVGLPEAVVWLLESQARKCAFIEAAAARMHTRRTRVVCARTEDWAARAGRHDLVVARAVGPQPVVLEYAAPLLELGGTLVDWRGRRDRDEEEATLRAGRELGLGLREIRRVKPFEGASDRHLHVFEKLTDTPLRFPRRAGMARKRPLGGRVGGKERVTSPTSPAEGTPPQSDRR